MENQHTHGNLRHERASKNIGLAFFLNLIFSGIELLGGLMTNSVAILSDAMHDFGDCISLGVSWYLQRVSGKGRDDRYSYGYRRYSLLGAMFISLVLVFGSVFILKEAIERILSPQEPNAMGMLLLAVVGLLVNGAVALRMKKGSSLNERAIFLHIMEDVLGWLAVLVAGVVMLFVHLPILDPLLSIGICLWVLSNVYKNLKATLKVFLQEVPENVEVAQLLKSIKALNGVLSVHDLHIWTLDGEEHIMTLHVVTEDAVKPEEQKKLKMNIRQVCDQFNVHHATIEMETKTERCQLIGC